MHGSLSKNKHFAAKGSLKLNNAINTCLVSQIKILCYS